MTPTEVGSAKFTRNYVLASIPALLLCFGVAFLLRSTAMSPGARTGMSFFSFVVLQTLLRRMLGEAGTARHWASVIGIGFVASLAVWFVANL